MVLQPKKCQLLRLGDTKGSTVRLGNFELRALAHGEPLSIMNLPLHTHVSDADFIAFLLDKARARFQTIKDILCSHAPLKARIRLLDKVVLAGFRWVVGCVFPSARVQQQLNSVQLSFVATMMRLRWNGLQGQFCIISKLFVGGTCASLSFGRIQDTEFVTGGRTRHRLRVT